MSAQAGDVQRAAALLDEAERAAEKCQTEVTIMATLSIYRLAVTSPATDREAMLARAEAIASAHECDDPRFALRVLSLADTRRETSRALVVREDGRAFRVPESAAEVDLARRAPLARILVALTRRRVESPGDAMRVEDILSAGWPDERVRHDAGANRVYVALAELRKLGLRDWMVKDDAGYRLVTSRPVVFAG
jgi:hypothetical protein